MNRSFWNFINLIVFLQLVILFVLGQLSKVDLRFWLMLKFQTRCNFFSFFDLGVIDVPFIKIYACLSVISVTNVEIQFQLF
jgi:hypothetical protein